MSGSTEYNFITNFYKSFSGTDTLVFIMMPGCNPVILGSITTVSYSQYRTKQPVINLGRTNINGVTRGTRIYAGTMIFTLINQHWLKDLMENDKLKWLAGHEELKSDELPLFDLMIVSANEYGSCVTMYIYGVDITDEGQVISVEDLFTENTLSFVARDITTFKAGDTNGSSKVIHKSANISEVNVNNFYIFDNSAANIDGENLAKNDIISYQESLINDQVLKMQVTASVIEKKQQLKSFTRELQYKPFDQMVGDDVGLVQTRLKLQNFLENVNYIYDKLTEEAVKQFQSIAGLSITGVVDGNTHIALLDFNSELSNPSGLIINESGTRVYGYPNIYSSIIGTIQYNNVITIYEKTEEKSFVDPVTKEVIDASGHFFYQIEQGYVVVSDVFSYEYSNKDIAFPTINEYETGPYVTLLQSSLVTVYGVFDYAPGVYDDNTIEKVTQLQSENDIVCILGTVNEETWRILYALTGELITDITNNKVNIRAINAQGKYSLSSVDMTTDLMQGFNITIDAPKNITIKCCIISYYSNESIKTITKSYEVIALETKTILFTDFQNAFTYDTINGFPTNIEYIVYPFNGDSCKWIIEYRGE